MSTKSEYVLELSGDSKEFTVSELFSGTERESVKILPDEDQKGGREQAVKFLKSLAQEASETFSFEIQYNADKQVTQFEMSYPKSYSSKVRTALADKYPSAKIDSDTTPNPIYSNAEQDGMYCSTAQFTLKKDIWRPIYGIDLEGFDDDPLQEILRSITEHGESDTSVVFQISFRSLSDTSIYTNRASLGAGMKRMIQSQKVSTAMYHLLTRSYNYSLSDRINDLEYFSEYANPKETQRYDNLKEKLTQKAKSTLYACQISLLAIGSDPDDIRTTLSSISARIENKTHDEETGQKLVANQPQSTSEISNQINDILTHRIPHKTKTGSWLKTTRTTPTILAHTSLSEFVHLSDSDISDPTIQFNKLGDTGTVPHDAPSYSD
jgi:hypothetical protein